MALDVMSVEFRQAERTDIAVLERDLKAAVGRTIEMELEEQREGIHSIYIAIAESTVVGWGFIRWLGPRDAAAMDMFPRAPEIFRLEVLDEYRSAGIGRRLIAAMGSAATSRGYSEVSLGVAHANPRAYSLYKRIGFEDTKLDEYFDEYQYPLEGGGYAVARDRCRYMIKQL